MRTLTAMASPLTRAEAQARMNLFGGQGIPFVFVIDFDGSRPIVLPTGEAERAGLWFDVGGMTNAPPPSARRTDLRLVPRPMPFERYRAAFDEIQEHIAAGHTYLANLTFATPVEVNGSLEEIFFSSRARYRFFLRGQWTVYSPETFVRIRGRSISTCPMKGTINAAVEHAERVLLEDQKEEAEHVTVVDLLRNDLSRVAANVRVTRFRYIDRLRTSGGELLQASSEITGDLPEDYAGRLGDIVFDMLPAGSVTGAPKLRTVEILKKVEAYERGYYTGVAGLFDGSNLDSCVLIRFVEQQEGGMVYKSGGGITAQSRPEDEYRELLQKIYVPFV